MKYRKRFLLAALLGAGAVTFLVSCKKEAHSEEVVKTSIFSWEEDYILPEQEEEIYMAMERLGCAAVYQEFPQDMEDEVVIEYLKRRSSKNQDVYYLAGDANWGLEEHAESMLEQVKRVDSLNKKAGRGSRFSGIVWDVEPYLTEEWDESPDQVMEQYINNLRAAYESASEKGLQVIVCIPNFYDKKGYEEELADLTENGCDVLAVMNYNKDDEAGQIRTEVELAKTYDKGIIHIVELQKPGYHELTEKNTYYYDGIGAVKESFEKLKKEFDYPKLGFSWHYMRPALELMDREEQR
ncbi:hypothetical protein HGO97_012735 [Faecalicatena sp. AGMB00832]|uniref:Uncharacterized protein n=1 Tax=Faecalicatena faecalis TaxID=2726362 RepID=A0ABS6D6A2_9FIRM|nr:hypothetical protein [Faecalicatena faecalis]MBU3876671.1 hypothetical protein [Faecalicatena faecalis]